MSRSRLPCAPTLAVACSVAFAQVPTAGAPAPGQGTGALTKYVSPLRDYRAFADEPVVSWREANETVQRIGGWQAYSREAYQALRKPAPEARPTPAAPAERDSHDAHHGAKR
jgi:hypothetical protein